MQSLLERLLFSRSYVIFFTSLSIRTGFVEPRGMNLKTATIGGIYSGTVTGRSRGSLVSVANSKTPK